MHPRAEDINHDIDDEIYIFLSIPIGNWTVYTNNDTEEMRFKLKLKIVPKLEICHLASITNYSSNPDKPWKITFDTLGLILANRDICYKFLICLESK